MIDLHCHVLPGIDDGPETIDGSVALARAAAEAGIATIVATPHVNSRTPNDAATISRLVDQLNVRLEQEGVAVDVRPGAEIAVSHVAEIDADELSRLGLGGGRWLLIEPPFTPVVFGLERLVLGLRRDGHSVVLAHPERCPALARDRHVVRSLADAGVLMSITAGSLTGRFGSEVRRFALALARDGLVHNVTSDAHDSVHRAPGLTTALEQAKLTPLAAWLTHDVPAAILADGPIPPSPGDPTLRARAGLRRWRPRR
jgi:protein-tyrosine phosphatase